MSDADHTLYATIIEANESSCSFSSFPVTLSIKYELKGSKYNWEKTITTRTDSRLACTTIFYGPVRSFHDEYLAFTSNYSIAIKELSEFIKNQK